MSATILLLVLATDPSSDTAASSLAAAAADGLEGRAHVELERVTTLPSDEEATRRAEAAKAEGVVEISWRDPDMRRAHVHAHLMTSPSWIDRDVTFDASSSPWERGRAVGLAVAAMVPDEAAATEPAPPPAAPVAPTPAPIPPLPVDVAPLAPPHPQRTWFDAALIAEGGTAGAFGGRLAASVWLTRRIGLRATFATRFSSIDRVDARVLHVDAGVGPFVVLLGEGDKSNVRIGADLRVAHESIDRRGERLAHTVPVAALFVDASVSLSSWSSVLALVGLERSLGTTTLSVDGQPAATLPTVGAFAGLGFRVRF